MTKLIDIQSKIESLQKQAAEIKAKESKGILLEIHRKMIAYGITVKDLNEVFKEASKNNKTKTQIKVGKSKANVKRESKVPVKYRGPNGEHWSGRGLTPKWLSNYIAGGQSKQEFLERQQNIPQNIKQS